MLIDLFDYPSFSPDVEPVFVLRHKGLLSTELEKRGAVVEFVADGQLNKPWTLITLWFQLWRILNKYKVNIIVSHEIDNHALAWAVERLFSIKSVSRTFIAQKKNGH